MALCGHSRFAWRTAGLGPERRVQAARNISFFRDGQRSVTCLNAPDAGRHGEGQGVGACHFLTAFLTDGERERLERSVRPTRWGWYRARMWRSFLPIPVFAAYLRPETGPKAEDA